MGSHFLILSQLAFAVTRPAVSTAVSAVPARPGLSSLPPLAPFSCPSALSWYTVWFWKTKTSLGTFSGFHSLQIDLQRPKRIAGHDLKSSDRNAGLGGLHRQAPLGQATRWAGREGASCSKPNIFFTVFSPALTLTLSEKI